MENPFESSAIATRPQGNAPLVEIEQQRAVAEVQSAIVLAKKFPREQKRAMDNILIACQRPTLAEQALYSYSRGGTEITGPSIRLAEAIAQNWQNLQFGIRELEQRNGESTVEAFAWDVENNTRQVKIFQVKHERHTKKGRYALEDPRDIYEMVANQGARRLRACILGIIPGDVVETAQSECEKTLKAKADTSPEALKKLLEAFNTFHVTKEQLEKRIQRNLETITAAQLIGLRKIYNSLKDGMSSAADWFEMAQQEEKKADANESLKEKIRKNKTAQQTEAKEEEDDLSPSPCPDNESVTYKKSHCDACSSRQGCPSWAQ